MLRCGHQNGFFWFRGKIEGDVWCNEVGVLPAAGPFSVRIFHHVAPPCFYSSPEMALERGFVMFFLVVLVATVGEAEKNDVLSVTICNLTARSQ